MLETFVYFACAHSTPRVLEYVNAQPPRHGVIKRTMGGSRHAGNALGRFGPRFRRGCVRRGAQGVNPAVSRRAGPNSARNERKRLGEPVLLFLRDNRTCPRNVRTVFHVKINISIWYYTSGQSGFEQTEVARRRPGAAECRNERHRARLASRRGGDGAHGHKAGEAWT